MCRVGEGPALEGGGLEFLLRLYMAIMMPTMITSSSTSAMIALTISAVDEKRQQKSLVRNLCIDVLSVN